MVASTLSLIMIDEGKSLVHQLDKSGCPVEAALWFYFPAPEEWKLVLSLPAFFETGPRAAYTTIQRRLSRLNKPSIDLSLIRVARPDSSLLVMVRDIASSALDGPRYSNQVAGGQIVDAYVYRL